MASRVYAGYLECGKAFRWNPRGKVRPRGSELDRFPHSSRGSAFNTKALLQKNTHVRNNEKGFVAANGGTP